MRPYVAGVFKLLEGRRGFSGLGLWGSSPRAAHLSSTKLTSAQHAHPPLATSRASLHSSSQSLNTPPSHLCGLTTRLVPLELASSHSPPRPHRPHSHTTRDA